MIGKYDLNKIFRKLALKKVWTLKCMIRGKQF